MAAFLLLAPLLLLGTVAGQEQTEAEECLQLGNATEGNFSVELSLETYQANKTYTVTIKDDRNHSDSSGQYLLQALSPQNASVGAWDRADKRNCSSVDTAILNINENTAHWTSPDSNLSSVQIRVYLSLSDNTTELKTFTLNREAEATTPPSTTPNSTTLPSTTPNSTTLSSTTPNSTTLSSTTPNSVGRAQSSSLFLAALQLPLLLLTGTLLS